MFTQTLTTHVKTKRIVLLTLIATFIIGVASAVSQESEDGMALLFQLHSDNWQQRARAVEKLAGLSIRRSKEINDALIDLLDRENRLVESTLRESSGLEGVSVKYGEAYSEYYAVLIGAVDQVANYNDQRTLSILVHSSYNSDSPFALERIAQYDPAANPTGDAGRNKYPVREEAFKAIRLIKSEENRKPM